MQAQDWITLAAAMLSLVGTALSVWLRLRIRVDLQAMEKSILATIEKRYTSREVLDEKFTHANERIARLERHAESVA